MSGFDEVKLASELSLLPWGHRLAFMASCCERLVPNYRAFALWEDWGSPLLVGQTLDVIWRSLDGPPLTEVRVRELSQACEAVVPDSEEFTTLFVSAAQDAVACVTYTLESFVDGDPNRAALAGRLAIGTIYQYLHTVGRPIQAGPLLIEVSPFGVQSPLSLVEAEKNAQVVLDDWVERAPLMIAELSKQQGDLNLLKGHTSLTGDFLRNLRQSSRDCGLQPFRRGLIPGRLKP